MECAPIVQPAIIQLDAHITASSGPFRLPECERILKQPPPDFLVQMVPDIELRVGTPVRVVGHEDPEQNGKTGVCKKFISSAQLWTVAFDGDGREATIGVSKLERNGTPPPGPKMRLSDIVGSEGKPVAVAFYDSLDPGSAVVTAKMEELAHKTTQTSIKWGRPPRVKFLLVNVDGLDKAEQYRAHRRMKNRCWHGHGVVPASYEVRYLPHRVLIGKDGLVKWNFDGFNWEEIEELIEEEEM